MRKPILAGNWKMNKTATEAVEFVNALKESVGSVTEREVVVCPVFAALGQAAEASKGSNIKIGAQNMHWEDSGAYTGEVSAEMLKDVGCEFVIIGHSERRQYFGETDETVNKKVKKALAVGLKPIVCIGEMLEERESEQTFKVIEKQILDGLKGISPEDVARLVIAYEPVWAIGTGKTATPQQAEEVHLFIRSLVAQLAGDEISRGVRILYGGSMKPDNVSGLMSCPNIDGGLIGGAALKVDLFTALVNFE